MFLINWLKNLFNYLKWDSLNAKILFVGLDNAGKTTLLRKLKDGRITQNDPTLHAHSEQIEIGSTKVRATDVGGHKAVRRIWRNYLSNIDGICYIIDSSCREKFQESKEEFDKLVSCLQGNNIPIAIIGNKIDMKEAISLQELQVLFEEESYKKKDNSTHIQIFMCSVTKGVGYGEALIWLTQQIKENQKQ